MFGWFKKTQPQEKEKLVWQSTPPYGGSESRRLVRESDGRILVEVVHGTGPGASWDVFKSGAGYGDFATEEQAKTFAETLV